MKYLLSVITFLTLVLSNCASIPATTQEIKPTETGSGQSLQENASTETSADSPSDLPKDIPYNLPTPADSRFISNTLSDGVYTLIFETSLTPESVNEFYAQALKDRGWMASPANEGGGIIANPDSDFWKVYCYRENEAFLAVETKSLSAEQTSIHLNLYTPFPDVMPCNADPNTLTLSIIYYYIPALHPPKGVAYLGGTADSHVGYAEMTADLKGDLSAEEVVDFYNDQLLAAGWKLVNRGHDEGSAWSNWTFQDDQGNDWIGSLKVDEESSSSDTLLASMTIEKIK